MSTPPTGSDYNQLRAFVAVAQSLSFSRAARLLGLSASALSQTVRGLEERLGVRLLNRTTRSVSLTEAGLALYDRVSPAVLELGQALDQTRALRDRPSGRVRIHSFRSAAETYIKPMLADFTRAYPDIVLDLTLDDEPVDIVAGGFDLSLRIGEVIEKDMIALRLGPDLRQIAVATPAYVARHGAPAHPRDLVHHRCIRWRWPGRPKPYDWEFFENGAWFSVSVDGPLIFNDKVMALDAALQGLGIGFAIDTTVAVPIAEGRLVPLLQTWSAPFPGHFVCYPQQRQMASALRLFIDALRSRTRTD